MNIIEISNKQITLTGLLLNSSIMISNPHLYLAVMFELESKPNILDIEPQRGMIMHKDQKYIKVNMKSHLRDDAHNMQRQSQFIVLRATYFCEYNKKIMQKMKQEGWSYLSKKLQQIKIPVKMNIAQERQKIKRSIKIDNDLQKSRKSNSFQKFRDSNVKKIKNSKLNEDLDFIFRNQEFKQKYIASHNGQFINKRQKNQHMNYNTSPQLFKNFTKQEDNKFNSPDKLINNNREFQLKSQKNYQNGHHFREKKDKIQAYSLQNSNNNIRNNGRQNHRALDLILLAIIAALAFACGEVFGRFFKY